MAAVGFFSHPKASFFQFYKGTSMASRRQVIMGGGAAALACALNFIRVEARTQTDGQIPPGGVPSIIKDGNTEGVVQLTYPDGKRIRIYENKFVILKDNQAPQEVGTFGSDIDSLPMPRLPEDEALIQWLNAHADDLRTTIRKLLRNDSSSNDQYDSYEKNRPLTVYKKILVRHKYIKRLSGIV
jgi:hypothetical protein